MLVAIFKYRLYPSKEQEAYLLRSMGSVRWVYNEALKLRTDAWRDKKRLSYAALSGTLTEWKKEHPFLLQAPAVCLQQSLRQLENATRANRKIGRGFPPKKRRKDGVALSFTRHAISIKGEKLYLARINDPVTILWTRPLPAQPSSAIVRQEKGGSWYVLFRVPVEAKPPDGKAKQGIGVNLSKGASLHLSNGLTMKPPRSLIVVQGKLVRGARSFARKKAGSRNQAKALAKVGRLHRRRSNIQRDFLHKASSWLIRENQAVYINPAPRLPENWGATPMPCLSWSLFKGLLLYKAAWRCRRFLVVADPEERGVAGARIILTAGAAASACGAEDNSGSPSGQPLLSR